MASPPSLHIPASRVRLVDAPVLQGRALALEHDADQGEAASLRQLVSFRLGPAACVADLTAVSRVVARLGEVLPIVSSHPVLRGVAFVDNIPVPVADLAGLGRAAPRSGTALAAGPALVVDKGGRPVAIAVEGPLDLLEDEAVRGADSQAGPGPIRFAGTTRSGALWLSSEWLAQWVAGF